VNQALATPSLDSSPETTRFGSGKSVKRLEDQQLLLGAGQYTNDVTLPGQSYLVFLRSPYPHAKITHLDTTAAKAMPASMASSQVKTSWRQASSPWRVP